MKQLHLMLAVAVFSGVVLLGTGCTARTQVSGHAHVQTTPTLVSVGSGLWVVEDYGAAVFYRDGYYWRRINGSWHRSTLHTGGWVQVNSGLVPRVVLRVNRPHRYVRYRARAGVRVKRGPNARPVVRDHRKTQRSKRDHRNTRQSKRDNRDRGKRDHRDRSKRDHR